jgi:hypothetical protein
MKCKNCEKDVFGAKIQKGTGLCKPCWLVAEVKKQKEEEYIFIDVTKKSFFRRLFHR